MRLQLASPKNFWAGLLFAAVAIFGLYVSRNYAIGTSTNMNFGYMPRLLCWILLALGIVIAVRGFIIRGDPIAPWPWRPLIMITSCIAIFGFAIEPLGFAVACVLLIVCGAFAGRDIRYRELAVTAVLLTAASIGIFVYVLELPISVWPAILR